MLSNTPQVFCVIFTQIFKHDVYWADKQWFYLRQKTEDLRQKTLDKRHEPYLYSVSGGEMCIPEERRG